MPGCWRWHGERRFAGAGGVPGPSGATGRGRKASPVRRCCACRRWRRAEGGAPPRPGRRSPFCATWLQSGLEFLTHASPPAADHADPGGDRKASSAPRRRSCGRWRLDRGWTPLHPSRSSDCTPPAHPTPRPRPARQRFRHEARAERSAQSPGVPRCGESGRTVLRRGSREVWRARRRQVLPCPPIHPALLDPIGQELLSSATTRRLHRPIGSRRGKNRAHGIAATCVPARWRLNAGG